MNKLLQDKKEAHTIPDCAFSIQSIYDRVLVYQLGVDEFKDGKAGAGSLIHIPEATEDREKSECPRGVIVSAGPRALDILKTNGLKLGETAHFLRESPYRIRVGIEAGKPVYLICLTAKDFIGSAELADRIEAGEVSMEYMTDKDKDGDEYCEHRFVTKGEGTQPREDIALARSFGG